MSYKSLRRLPIAVINSFRKSIVSAQRCGVLIEEDFTGGIEVKNLSSAVILAVGLLASTVASAQSITPFNTQISADGSEVITDYFLSLGNGSYEIFSARFGDNVFQVAGSETIPSTWTGPLRVTTRGSVGGPIGPELPQAIGGGWSAAGYSSGTQDRRSNYGHDGGADVQGLPLLIWAGAGLVTAGACASGWYATRRALISSCRAQGRGWDRISIGRCGIAGTSSIECEEVEDGEGSNVLSWTSFGSTNLPASYAIDQYIFQLQIPSNDGY